MTGAWADTVAGHRAQMRERVLQAFRRAAHKHGLTAVTMAALADEADIGRATLYKHFPDLHSVVLAWAADEFDRFAAEVEQATADAPPDEAIGALLLAASRHLASEDHEFSTRVMHASLSPEGAAALQSHTARLVDVFVRTLTPVATDSLSAELLADVLIGALDALRSRLADGSLRPTDAVALVSGLLGEGRLASARSAALTTE